MNSNNIDQRCIFGDTIGNGRNHVNVNALGRLAGIDSAKIYVLADDSRSFLGRLTDILLIDPVGRMINRRAGASEKRKRDYEESDYRNFPGARSDYAAKDIFRRKCATTVMGMIAVAAGCGIKAFTSIALPQLSISLLMMYFVGSYFLHQREVSLSRC